MDRGVLKTIGSKVLSLVMIVSVMSAVACKKTEKYIKIDENNFPDKNFRMYVEQHTGSKNSDGKVSESKLAAISDLELRGVKNYKGLEYFTGIKVIELHGCSFEEISFGENKDLVRINFKEKCDVKKIDVSGNSELEELYCRDVGLEELILPEGDKLKNVYCSDNNLSTIDVTGCRGLKELSISENSLKELDVSNCFELDYLICHGNDLTELDITYCPKLVSLAKRESEEDATINSFVHYQNGYHWLEYDVGVELIW